MATKSGAVKRAKSITQQLRNLTAALPTEAEKQEIRRHLEEVATFFSEMRQLLDGFPIAEDVQDLQAAATKITEILERIEANPQAASMFGIRRPSPRTRIVQPTEAEVATAKFELPRLKSLPVDEIREELLGPRYSPSTLRAIATALGLKTDSRVGREAMAHRIAMNIANYRGYEQLGGEPAKTESAAEIETESQNPSEKIAAEHSLKS
jgi:hypothetical protein